MTFAFRLRWGRRRRMRFLGAAGDSPPRARSQAQHRLCSSGERASRKVHSMILADSSGFPSTAAVAWSSSYMGGGGWVGGGEFPSPLCLAVQHLAAVAGQVCQAERGKGVEGEVGRTGKPADLPDRGLFDQDVNLGVCAVIAQRSECARTVGGMCVQWHEHPKLRSEAGEIHRVGRRPGNHSRSLQSPTRQCYW